MMMPSMVRKVRSRWAAWQEGHANASKNRSRRIANSLPAREFADGGSGRGAPVPLIAHHPPVMQLDDPLRMPATAISGHEDDGVSFGVQLGEDLHPSLPARLSSAPAVHQRG